MKNVGKDEWGTTVKVNSNDIVLIGNSKKKTVKRDGGGKILFENDILKYDNLDENVEAGAFGASGSSVAGNGNNKLYIYGAKNVDILLLKDLCTQFSVKNVRMVEVLNDGV